MGGGGLGGGGDGGGGEGGGGEGGGGDQLARRRAAKGKFLVSRISLRKVEREVDGKGVERKGKGGGRWRRRA